MSKYRCPLFGQGDENDLYGAALHHKELIPELDDGIGGLHPVALPLDSGNFPGADFTTPSAMRWFWRARSWTATMLFTVPSEGISLSASFAMPDIAAATGLPFTDEDQLHDPLNGRNAHYRSFEGEADLGTGPDGDDKLSAKLHIGSFTDPAAPAATLDTLFRERSDGTFAPRIYVSGEVFVDGTDDDILVQFNSIDAGDSLWTLVMDGQTISTTLTYSHPYGVTAGLAVEFTPSLFWSWDGIWNTTTGAAISNPRV